VYIGGLGRVFTEIYDLEAHRANRQHSNLYLTQALNLQVLDVRQANRLRLNGSKIFVLTAGMMSENTAAHDLAVQLVREERNGIFFVGYADPDTPGGRLKTAKKGEPFHFSPSAGELTQRCRKEDFDLTAHANREDLMDLVDTVDPKAVLLTHGDKDSRDWFAQELGKRHPKIRVMQPASGESIEL
jgi:Cft2 family RNA processing exonuclease